MNLKIKEEYLDCFIVHPATAKDINVKFQIDPAEYEYYYNKGYQHLFDVEPVKEKSKNDLPKPDKQ